MRPLERAALWSVNVFVAMLLVLVCGNVALLMFARAATREAEIVVRGALGASRGRIVMQFFAEALVLGSVAAVVGLADRGAGDCAGACGTFQVAAIGDNERLPFWFNARLDAVDHSLRRRADAAWRAWSPASSRR